MARDQRHWLSIRRIYPQQSRSQRLISSRTAFLTDSKRPPKSLRPPSVVPSQISINREPKFSNRDSLFHLSERLHRQPREKRTKCGLSSGIVKSCGTALKGIAIRLPGQQPRCKEENTVWTLCFLATGRRQLPGLSIFRVFLSAYLPADCNIHEYHEYFLPYFRPPWVLSIGSS